MMKQLIALLVMSALFASCDNKGPLNFTVEQLENLDTVEMDTDTVTFDTITNKILKTKCLNCHSADEPAGGIDLTDYNKLFTQAGNSDFKVVVTGKPAESSLYLEVFNKTMPKREALPDDEVELIRQWIADGAVESGKVSYATLDLNFANVQKYIINDSCLRCHDSDGPRAGVDLSSYDSMFTQGRSGKFVVTKGNPAESTFYTEIHEGSMPPSRGEESNKLSDEKIDFVKRWIEAGAPGESQTQVDPTPTPVPVVVLADLPADYKNVKQYILDDSCIRCHDSAGPRAGVDLSQYSTLFTQGRSGKTIVTPNDLANSSLYTEVHEGSMPPSRGEQNNKLSDDKITFIKRWIEEGAVEEAVMTPAPTPTAQPVIVLKDIAADYENVKKYILEDSCIGCHNANRAKAGVDLSQYSTLFGAGRSGDAIVTVGKPSDSTLYKTVHSGDMPPSRGDEDKSLSDEQVEFIKRFIEEGAVEKASSEVVLADLEANFDNVFKHIIEDKCLRCHKTDRARGEVDLSSYETMFGYTEYFSEITVPGKPDDSAFYTEIFSGNMPPSRGDENNKLSDEEIAFVKRWIDEGAKQ